MPDICPKCGLPKEICVCNVLDKETEGKIKVSLKKAKFDKYLLPLWGE
jgi:translation initiation factor 1